MLSSTLSPSHSKQVCTVWFSLCHCFILGSSNKRCKKPYQEQRPSYNWKTDNFPNQMWLWPKSGGEETVIHPGMLINYHTDCLLIFLCSLMKYIHFIQTSHRMADADSSKADTNSQVGQVSSSRDGQGQGKSIHPQHQISASRDSSPVSLIKAKFFRNDLQWSKPALANKSSQIAKVITKPLQLLEGFLHWTITWVPREII